MSYWTVKENDNITVIQTYCNDVLMNMGRIEKPYRNSEHYFASGWNSEMLGKDGCYSFKSFEEAETRIIDHFIKEMEVLRK